MFYKFNELKAWFENQIIKNIKVLTFDNEGEYTSEEFSAILYGSKDQEALAIPYTLQHNGVAEGKNMSIVETTTTMIHKMGMGRGVQHNCLHSK